MLASLDWDQKNKIRQRLCPPEYLYDEIFLAYCFELFVAVEIMLLDKNEGKRPTQPSLGHKVTNKIV